MNNLKTVSTPMHFLIECAFNTLPQKIFFQSVVLPELMAVVEKYKKDLFDLGMEDEQDV